MVTIAGAAREPTSRATVVIATGMVKSPAVAMRRNGDVAAMPASATRRTLS